MSHVLRTALRKRTPRSNLRVTKRQFAASSSFSEARVLKDTYKDSIELMRLSNQLKSVAGVKDAAIMMATAANIELLKNAGLISAAEAASYTISDLIISVSSSDANVVQTAIKQAIEQITAASGSSFGKSGSVTAMVPKTIEEGVQVLPEANFVLISSPGDYATAEGLKALRRGLNVFMFSNNVSIEDEKMLKTFAVERGLFLMGPDCGTGVLDGIPFAFANAVRRGPIGLVSSSGTGSQQVSCLIDKFGSGISQMFGTGGRDLKEKIGGLMTLSGFDALEKDENTLVITVVSKGAPGATAQKALCEKIKSSKKPVVVVLLGADEATTAELSKAGASVATTLEDAAVLSIQALQGRKREIVPDPNSVAREKTTSYNLKPEQKKIYGLFAGGTHAGETKVVFSELHKSPELSDFEYEVLDLGDDEYCVGKPHPMIDPSTRNTVLLKTAAYPETAVIIFDVVLGYGSHDDPATNIASVIKEARAKYPNVTFVGHVCGVEGDFQGLDKAEIALVDAGVVLLPTNAQASRVAVQIVNRRKPHLPIGKHVNSSPLASSKTVSNLFGKTGVINIGLQSFTGPITSHGGEVVHLDWKPPAKGNREAGLKLADLMDDKANANSRVSLANQEAITRLKAGTPVLVDVKTASDVIPGFTGKKIAHAGPPVTWEKMCGPMRGAVLGAVVYEGWATDLKQAEDFVANGNVEFQPCHHWGAVGPMTGILSPSFPVSIIENTAHKNRAYCSLNEGLGKVLRMGANSDAVLNKLRWIKEELAPTLAQILAETGPVDLRAITQQAIMMGDECHNRNAAATSLFTRAIAPFAAGLPHGRKVLEFLKENDHFYLNLQMAACKAVLDSASGIKGSTICTVMARNGVEFGVRLSGTGSQWFTAPAPMIKGLYFPGFSEADANPDIGDSSITETFGVGGFSMAAAPAIVKFVGGNASDAMQNTKEMYRITSTRHSVYTIPNLDFEGIPLGLDARKVVDTLINPVINTGIAHKVAGIGQVGAGLSLAPLEPFIKGIEAVWQDLHSE